MLGTVAHLIYLESVVTLWRMQVQSRQFSPNCPTDSENKNAALQTWVDSAYSQRAVKDGIKARRLSEII